ncbi:PQQ-binding-like beta-propeller repeat protein [Candidatus Obscuribacterales bacterium]|nr:PQQ-binding-like beta-propeller repeat protein [Candidatus Obscuribacterales bacterium]
MTAIFAHNDKLEDGHYTVLKELGVGGMGVVYHCRDEFLQRDVAIKMLLPELMADPKNVEVFTEEARLAARMDHPNIVTVYDIGVENRQSKAHHFVAMEYLPGGNLAVRTQGAALAVEHALNWMKQLSNGLYFAHRKGVVHQDVKADNIFITTEGDLKIGDFGLARLMANKVYINPSTKGMGTPAYMSPELCRGEQQDQRSDMYSLGILFFEMVTGQLPYRANGMIEMAMKHTTAPIPSVRRLNPEVPDVLDRLIRRMMEKSPYDRYQSLNEVLKILDDLIFDMRVARMGLTTKRTSQRVDTANEVSSQERAKAAAEAVSKPPAPTPPKRESAGTPRHDTGVLIPGTVQPQEGSSASTAATPVSNNVASPNSGAGTSPAKAQPPAPMPAKNPGRLETNPLEVPKGQVLDSNSVSSSTAKAQSSKSAVDRAASNASQMRGVNAPDTRYGAKPKRPFDDRADISHTRIEAAGIKMFEPVGPVREPSQKIAKIEEPRISAYSIPVIEGLNPLLTEVWTFKTGGPIGWNSTPVAPLDDEGVYVASADGTLYKLHRDSGELIWRYDSNSMMIAGPVVRAKDVLVGTTDGALIKLDSATGAQQWKTQLNHPIVSVPVIANQTLIVPTLSGKVSCLDINDAGKLWDVDLKSPIVCNPAVYGDNTAFVSTRDGNIHSLQVRNGKELWRANLDGPIVSAPAVSADSIYVGTQAGTFFSLDIQTGESTWEHQCSRGIISGATIVFTSVIFCSQDKWLYGCEKYDGRLRWKAAVKGTVQSTLSVAAQTVIAVSREGWMQGFDAGNGHMKWQKNFGRRLESQPLIMKDGMLIASVEGELTFYAFGARLQKSA